MSVSNPGQDPPEEDEDDYEEEDSEDEVLALEDVELGEPSDVVPREDLDDFDKLMLARARHDQMEQFETKIQIWADIDLKTEKVELGRSEGALLKNQLFEFGGILRVDDGSFSNKSTKEIERRASLIFAVKRGNYPLAAPRRKRRSKNTELKNRLCKELAKNPNYVPPMNRKLIVKDISHGRAKHAIAVLDDLQEDTSRLPKFPKFEYIDKNDVTTTYDEPITYSCGCDAICTSKTCSCIALNNAMNSDGGPIMRNGVVFIKKPVTDVFTYSLLTCGDLCSCLSTCPNRIENALQKSRFEIYRASPVVGFGVRTLTSISFGQIVSEFTGEVKTGRDLLANEGSSNGDTDSEDEEKVHHTEWALELGSNQTTVSWDPSAVGTLMDTVIGKIKGAFDQFDMKKENWKNAFPKDHLHIDPVDKGNEAKYFSHACWPNLQLIRVVSNVVNTEHHRLIFYARQDIPAGTELSFNYGKSYIQSGKFQCQCQTILCRNNHATWNVLGNDLKKFTTIDIMKAIQHNWKITRKETDNRLLNLYYEGKRHGIFRDDDEYYAHLEEPMGEADNAAAHYPPDDHNTSYRPRDYSRTMNRQEGPIQSGIGSSSFENDGSGESSAKHHGRGRPRGSKNRPSSSCTTDVQQNSVSRINRKRSAAIPLKQPDYDEPSDEDSGKEDSPEQRDPVTKKTFSETLRSGVFYRPIDYDMSDLQRNDVLGADMSTEQTQHINAPEHEEMEEEPPTAPEGIVNRFLRQQRKFEKQGKTQLELQKERLRRIRESEAKLRDIASSCSRRANYDGDRPPDRFSETRLNDQGHIGDSADTGTGFGQHNDRYDDRQHVRDRGQRYPRGLHSFGREQAPDRNEFEYQDDVLGSRRDGIHRPQNAYERNERGWRNSNAIRGRCNDDRRNSSLHTDGNSRDISFDANNSEDRERSSSENSWISPFDPEVWARNAARRKARREQCRLLAEEKTEEKKKKVTRRTPTGVLGLSADCPIVID